MKNTLMAITGLLTALSMMNANADSFDFGHARPGHPGMNLPGNDFGDLVRPDRPGRPGRPGRPDRPVRPGRFEQVEIYYGDQHFVGRDSVLYLKREIMNQHPYMSLQDYDLEGVTLVAKSKMGRGQAELMVGNSSQDRGTIGGDPRDFQSAMEYTFDRVQLNNYSGRDNGAWQIHMDGNIKVRSVIVYLQREFSRPPHPPRPPRLTTVELGTDKADKVIEDRESFSANQHNVGEIIIQGRDEVVDIREVVVVFGNGDHQRMWELEGYVRDCESRRAQLYGLRNVQRVIVTATSPNLIGSRGKYAVLLGVAR